LIAIEKQAWEINSRLARGPLRGADLRLYPVYNDEHESMKLVFAHSYCFETVTSVLNANEHTLWQTVQFLRATAVPAGTAEARISYGDSVCLSVRPSQPGAEPSPGEIETSGLHHMIA